MQMIRDFREEIDALYGTYLDATTGFIKMSERFQNEAPGASLLYGKGPPDDKNVVLLHKVTFTELLERNKENGQNFRVMGHLLIISVYQLWEDFYRGEISHLLGNKVKNDLKSDFFYELGIIRHAITHNQGNRISKFDKLKRLKFLDKEYVHPLKDDVQKLIEEFNKELTEIEKSLPN
jgi:hypothetical protein